MAAAIAHPQWRAVQDMFTRSPEIIGHCESPTQKHGYPKFRLGGIEQKDSMYAVAACVCALTLQLHSRLPDCVVPATHATINAVLHVRLQRTRYSAFAGLRGRQITDRD